MSIDFTTAAASIPGILSLALLSYLGASVFTDLEKDDLKRFLLLMIIPTALILGVSLKVFYSPTILIAGALAELVITWIVFKDKIPDTKDRFFTSLIFASLGLGAGLYVTSFFLIGDWFSFLVEAGISELQIGLILFLSPILLVPLLTFVIAGLGRQSNLFVRLAQSFAVTGTVLGALFWGYWGVFAPEMAARPPDDELGFGFATLGFIILGVMVFYSIIVLSGAAFLMRRRRRLDSEAQSAAL